MPMDNTDSVSMDFRTTQTPFLARCVSDEVARTGDMAHGQQVVYDYISGHVTSMTLARWLMKWLGLSTWHMEGRLSTATSVAT